MALAPLATVADLSALGIVPTDAAEALLDGVSAAVRDAAGAVIGPRTSSVIELTGSTDRYLALSVSPVRSVTTVTLDGVAVTDWRLTSGRLWRACGWSSDCGPAAVVVTLDHGLDTVPADIVNLVCMFVAAGLAASADAFAGHRGLQSFAVDDYREGYASGADEVVDVTEIPQRTKDALRARFGRGGASVTSSVS